MKDFSLQGKVWLGTTLGTGKPGPMRWVGDVPLLNVQVETDEEERTESWSGSRGTSAVLKKATKVTGGLTLNEALALNLALALHGSVASVAAGTATAEAFPTGLVAGDVVALDNGDISALVVTDNAGSPATLVAGTDYAIESAKGGLVKILNVGSYLQPFKAAYSFGAQQRIAMLTAQAPEKYLLFVGVNTLDNTPVRLRLYRTRFKPVEELGLINDSFGELALSFDCLIDAVNVADPLLGGFGRLEYLGTV